MAMYKGFRVFEKSKPPSPHSVLLEYKGKENTLLFESQAVAVLSAQETDAVKKQYTKILDAYGCLGVLQQNSGELTTLYLVMITGCFSIGKIGDSEIFRITQTQFIPLHYAQNEERISEIRKLLNSGTFYFVRFSGPPGGKPIDLTLCAQRRNKTSVTDHRFFWNRMLHVHLVRFGVDCNAWLVKAMCGSVEMRTVYVGHRKAFASVISRLSCERAGTRFNVRGANDDGQVANFVETEQVIVLDNEVTSYIQTRGSVPLFWEQPGMQVGPHKVRMSRGYEASKPAFNRHMATIKERYGKQVIVNLLGTNPIGSKESEAILSQEFQNHHNESVHSDIMHVIFDYHQECRGGNQENLQKLKSKLQQKLDEFSFYHTNGTTVYSLQTGTIRTNCLDCLDRTNSVQTFLGLEILIQQLSSLQLDDKKQNMSRFIEVFKQMWVNNGNEISKIYAGTGALQGESKFMDGARSAARTIQNNLLDNSKQEAIDILLIGSTLNSEIADRARTLLPHNTLHAPNHVLREMCKRYQEYTEPMTVRIAVGTYNVNGGKQFRSSNFTEVNLYDWLLDAHLKDTDNLVNITASDEELAKPADIYAIGFEEIVDLNAANIVNSSTENAKMWAKMLLKALIRDREYVLLTYQQLVGVCLYIFVKPEHVPYIRDVAVDSVKTGLGGHTGNKGATAIRFVFYATSMAFVCAHFAAGQSQVTERNADYNEITRKITFPMSRSLNSHEYLFWCGDFNYRVNMDKDEIKRLVKLGDYQAILQYDQLKKQQEEGNAFKNFIEGDINFAPTYKYDVMSDEFDTSEKARAPAWTDRVLWKRRPEKIEPSSPTLDCNPGKLIYYGRAELKEGDHRPVIALIDIEIRRINENNREKVLYEVIRDMGPPDATVIVHCEDPVDNDETVFDDNVVVALLESFAQFGETILVRFVGDTMWITFRDGQTVLDTLAKTNGKLKIQDYNFTLSMKTPNWVERAKEEISLFSSNTIPLYASPNQTDYNCLGIPDVGKPTRPLPPNRPPLPAAKIANSSPKRPPPRAGVISMPNKSSQPQPVSNSNFFVPSNNGTNPFNSNIVSPNIPPGVPPNTVLGFPPSQVDTTPQNPVEEGVYEEISDDIPEPMCPPPPLPPPKSDNVAPPTPSRGGGPPPVPSRSGIPPPLPARPRQ